MFFVLCHCYVQQQNFKFSIIFQPTTEQQNNASEKCADIDNALLPEGLNHYKYSFIFAMVFIGMGATPLYTLGVAYLDENLKTKMSPVYIGKLSVLPAIPEVTLGGHSKASLTIPRCRIGTRPWPGNSELTLRIHYAQVGAEHK